jgi:hypothetical protein
MSEAVENERNTQKMTKGGENPIDQINRLHAELNGLAIAAIDRAIHIGELLCREKETINHGEWLPWLRAHISFSERTANNYMSVFRNRERLKSANVADLSEAYRMLSDRAANTLHSDDDGPKPRMSYAEAAELQRQIIENFHRIFESLGFLANYDALRAEGERSLRERLGEDCFPVVLVDKINALARAKVPRETAAREVSTLALRLCMNDAEPGWGDEVFPVTSGTVAPECAGRHE